MILVGGEDLETALSFSKFFLKFYLLKTPIFQNLLI